MRALAAVYPLMIVVRMHHFFFLFRGREMPCGGLLMVHPNDGMVV
jgi:hypothetical protein